MSQKNKNKDTTQAPQKAPLPILPQEYITLWIAPWMDENGVFYDGQRCYIITREKRWAYAQSRKILRAKERVFVLDAPEKRESKDSSTPTQDYLGAQNLMRARQGAL